MTPLGVALAARIVRDGPLPYGAFVDAALYDDEHGFYVVGGHAGRRGDFLTSPEVGPLFGAVLSRALDQWWAALGRPDPFTVVEVGAGTGTLARSVLASSSAQQWGAALRWVAVERSAEQRGAHPDRVESLAAMPAARFTGVIVANELCDNLPFDLVEIHAGTWHSLVVDVDVSGRLIERRGVAVGATLGGVMLPDPRGLADGVRYPVQQAASTFLRTAIDHLEHGMVVLFDYTASDDEFLGRPSTDWVRTYRRHERGGVPLDEPGTQDITCDVSIGQLRAVATPTEIVSQRAFLQQHGIDELVEEGRQRWHAGAGVGDLAALKARSRIREAEALCDPAGLGGFTVMRWVR